MSGPPGPVRRQLRGSSRMEHMTLEQILARTRALMTEEVEVDKPVAAAAGRRRVLPRVPVGPPSTPTNRTQSQCIEVSGKRGKEREVGTTLSPHKLEEVLPVMKVKVNGVDRIEFVDSGCSSVVSRMLCRPEVRKGTAVLTASSKCLLSHDVGSITLTVTNRNPIKINVLVVNSKLLGFDLLLVMNVI